MLLVPASGGADSAAADAVAVVIGGAIYKADEKKDFLELQALAIDREHQGRDHGRFILDRL